MPTVNVLYLCVGNSCRSIMAEAMTRALGRGRVVGFSAGLSPAGFVAEDTVATLAALGYPTDDLYSKGLDRVPLGEMDVVVSLLGPSGLQLVPAHVVPRRQAWPVRDPFGDDPAVYRLVAREIEGRVRGLVDDLVAGEPWLEG